jgi:hypothetical protein
VLLLKLRMLACKSVPRALRKLGVAMERLLDWPVALKRKLALLSAALCYNLLVPQLGVSATASSLLPIKPNFVASLAGDDGLHCRVGA